jgi:wyosine [tRNA(Phe)-imidazoG37] synthetase (radical SAM superfamily)
VARSGGDNSCLFGPVNSRRLGVSLGIDLIKFKTCTFNCVFCECGATTTLTAQRQVFIPTGQVLKELKDFFGSASPHRPEVLTFSGGGEPTLAANIGEIIRAIKKPHTPRLCLLTNSSLLSDRQVRAEILPADIIIPSLNAVSPEIFARINRPLKGLTPEKIIAGLLELRKAYRGQLLLEIFLVPGLNDTPQELELLLKAARQIAPDGIQLNSLDRRGTEGWVRPMPPDKLQKIKEFFGEFNTNYYLKR